MHFVIDTQENDDKKKQAAIDSKKPKLHKKYPTGKHCKIDFPLIIIVHSHDLLFCHCHCCQIPNQYFSHQFFFYRLWFFLSMPMDSFTLFRSFIRSGVYIFHFYFELYYTFGFICMCSLCKGLHKINISIVNKFNAFFFYSSFWYIYIIFYFTLVFTPFILTLIIRILYVM